MTFTEVYLDKLLQGDGIPSPLLFAGANGSNKETAALSFARKWVGLPSSSNESHPDLLLFTPGGKLGLHSLDNLRTLREEVYLPPYASRYKVFVILEADRMAVTSANALLKTLEEPTQTSIILLVSAHPEKLLPTIRSRCQTLYFRQVHSFRMMSAPSLLIEILSSLDHLSHYELLEHVQALAQELEKHGVAPSREHPEELTVQQKHALEKEREGQEAVYLSSSLEALFQHILGWCRDLHLLHLRGNPSYLFFPEQVVLLQQKLERGILPSLEPIEVSLTEAQKHLDRSAPLQGTLETLFLKLRTLYFNS